MGKFITIIFSFYVVYYTANIIYDLFIKQEHKKVENDDVDEFSLENVAEENEIEVQRIEIDDVENLLKSAQEEIEEPKQEDIAPDMDNLKRKFESEQNLEKTQSSPFQEPQKDIKEKLKDVRQQNKDRFKQMMKMAETSVQMVGTIEGQKVYQSVMQF